MRQPDQRVGPPALYRRVGQGMGAAQVANHAVHAGDVTVTPGRKFADDPAVDAVDVRFVDGAPQADQVSELVDHSVHERHESVGRTPGRPTTPAGKPDRTCEVVEGDHGLDALLA